jgi:hypothetical protein
MAIQKGNWKTTTTAQTVAITNAPRMYLSIAGLR